MLNKFTDIIAKSKYTKVFLQSFVLKSVFTLISGTAIAQIILIIFQLILRRIYPAEVFGTYAIYASILSVLAILSTGRYHFTVVLPKPERMANSLVAGGIIISLLFNIFILLIIVLFKDLLVSKLDFPKEYSFWLYFLPLSTFLFSVYMMFNYWLTRKAAFKSISINKVYRRIFEGFTQTGLGTLGINAGLLFGELVGNLANVVSGLFQAKKNGFTVKNITRKKISFSLKRYVEFPKYQTIPALLNSISLMLPIIILNKFYNTEIVGYFDLSKQMLSVPIALVTASMSQVLLKSYVDKVQNKKTLTSNILKTVAYLSLLMIPVLILLMFFGKQLFGFVFSSDWSVSGKFAAILAPAFAIKFIITPLNSVFIATEKVKLFAFWQVYHFLLILLLFFLRDMGVETFLIIYCVVDSVAYLTAFIIIIFICKKHDKNIAKNLNPIKKSNTFDTKI